MSDCLALLEANIHSEQFPLFQIVLSLSGPSQVMAQISSEYVRCERPGPHVNFQLNKFIAHASAQEYSQLVKK